MKPEKILEIARRFTVPEVVGAKEWPMVYWEFCEEELLAFAKSVIEANRECSDEPVAWYDKHGMITHDPFEGVTPLYTRPAPARKPLSDEEVEKEFDRRCELDCCPDFSEAVRWAEKMHGIRETE